MNYLKKAFLIAKRAASLAIRLPIYSAAISVSFVFDLSMSAVAAGLNLIRFVKFNLIDRPLLETTKGYRDFYSMPDTLSHIKPPFEKLYNNTVYLRKSLYILATAPLQTELERVKEVGDSAHSEQAPSYFNTFKNTPAFIYSKMPAMPLFRSDRSNSSSPAKPKLA